MVSNVPVTLVVLLMDLTSTTEGGDGTTGVDTDINSGRILKMVLVTIICSFICRNLFRGQKNC